MRRGTNSSILVTLLWGRCRKTKEVSTDTFSLPPAKESPQEIHLPLRALPGPGPEPRKKENLRVKRKFVSEVLRTCLPNGGKSKEKISTLYFPSDIKKYVGRTIDPNFERNDHGKGGSTWDPGFTSSSLQRSHLLENSG